MTLLTQRNATIVAGLTVAWASLHQAGAFPDAPWQHVVGPILTALTAFLTFMGFNVTPNGGKLPEEIKSLPAGVDAPSPIADAQADSRAAARDAAIQTIKGQ